MSKQKKKKSAGVFFKTLFISTVILSALVFGLYFGIKYFISPKDDVVAEINEDTKPQDEGNLLSNIIGVPDKTNFAILGTDETGTRTDFIMVGCYNDIDETVGLISVPRDTMVTMPQDRLDTISQTSAYVPEDGVMKLCEVYHFAGEEYGLEYTVKQLEDELGVEFDYYALVNLEAFNYIVTEMGGVEFDVPQRMYYNDPAQDLYIDLYPGLQTLNAEQAEGLVRYRKADPINPISPGYPNDEARMKVQQDFLKAMIDQLLEMENIVGNFKTVLTAFFEYIETNLSVTDAMRYANSVKDFSSANINTYILPSTEQKINGKSYQVLDEAEKDRIVNEVFYTTEEVSESSKDKSIEVLNGGYTAGLASKTEEILENNGFNVVSVGDYTGEKQEQTRIIVKEKGQGEDLLDYFTNSVIEVDPEYPTDNDIVIILGTSAI